MNADDREPIRRSIVAFVFALFALATAALAEKPSYILNGKVVKIADGDTLTVLDDANAQHRIRLAGIDAPEKRQPFGTKSRQSLADKVFGKTVRVEVVDIDRYHREVGRIYLGDRFVNMEQVRDGMAWRYTRYDKPGEFMTAEREARVAKRGIWSESHPVPPWEWRRKQKQVRRIEGKRLTTTSKRTCGAWRPPSGLSCRQSFRSSSAIMEAMRAAAYAFPLSR